jgi:hypothetical protein
VETSEVLEHVPRALECGGEARRKIDAHPAWPLPIDAGDAHEFFGMRNGEFPPEQPVAHADQRQERATAQPKRENHQQRGTGRPAPTPQATHGVPKHPSRQ